MLGKLAWRNIWRNKRRTVLTIASVAFAVFFACLMQSIQRGAWDHMLSNVVNFYYGYVQIHQKGYWEEQSLDKSLALSPTLQDELLQVEGVRAVVPRLESFALASTEEETSGVLVVGTDPEAEDELTDLRQRLAAGDYWETEPTGALVATGVAEQLAMGVGDTIVLISQGYRGANAAGKYPISGLLKFGSPELNKRMVYLPIETADYFFAAPGQATSLALKLDDKEAVPEVMAALHHQLDTAQYEIMAWQEKIPELVEARQLDKAGNDIVLLILYLIISFGVFGTILMMTCERQYEFGILVGVGMQRWQLGLTVWLEILLLGALGAVVGILISLPLVYFFQLNPIDLSAMGEEAVQAYEKFGLEPILPAAVSWDIFLNHALIVFIITSILAVYPYLKIRKLEPIKAMRSG